MRIRALTLPLALLLGCASDDLVSANGPPNRTLALALGQELGLTLQSIGPGEYASPPTISSAARPVHRCCAGDAGGAGRDHAAVQVPRCGTGAGGDHFSAHWPECVCRGYGQRTVRVTASRWSEGRCRSVVGGAIGEMEVPALYGPPSLRGHRALAL